MNLLFDAFLQSFSRCVACDLESAAPESFPLCMGCLDALKTSPPLCKTCGSPGCISADNVPKKTIFPIDYPENNSPENCSDDECQSPWLKSEWTASQFALFQLTDSSYEVLKRWKTRRGPAFDRRVLKRANWDLLRSQIAELRIRSGWNQIRYDVGAIIPMPQRYCRSWKMGGSPADILASWVSRETKIPKLRTLRRKSNLNLNFDFSQQDFKPTKRQAELAGWERIQTKLDFEVDPYSKPLKSVILVDDFSTTGHTIQEAAKTLRMAGYGEVHTLCLGIKNSVVQKSETQNLGIRDMSGVTNARRRVAS